MFDAQGNLWGTAAGGGTHNQGTIFKMTTDGTFTTEYNFEGGMNGGVPYAGLIQDPKGTFTARSVADLCAAFKAAAA